MTQVHRAGSLWLRGAICALGGLMASAGATAATRVEAPAGFVTEVLDNGLRVSIHADQTMPVVSTQVWYHVGSANEDRDSRGFAHLFEHLMFGETENYAKDEYANHHHRFGGYENAYTTQDETVYVSQIAPEHHRPVLEMEADRMVNLLLDQQNLDNEKRIVTEELRLRTENDPQARVYVAALKAVLGNHPYAHLPTGTKQDIAAASLDRCRRFYARYYRPRNAHLVIAGPVDAATTLDAVKEIFGRIPAGGAPPADVPRLDEWSFPEEVELKEDLPPVETALLAFPLPPASAEDYQAVELMVHLLSRSKIDPFEDELVRRREKAVFAATEVITARRGGALVFSAGFLPYRRKKTAFRLMEQTRQKLAGLEWLTEASLESAKRTMIRRDLQRCYFSNVAAEQIGKLQWWQGGGRRAFDAAERIKEVRRDQVEAAFEKYVAGQQPVRVYLVPERVPWYIRLFGWLYPLVS